MWLYLPSTCFPSAPESAGSTSELAWPQAEQLARSATLSEKHALPARWRRAWRTEASIRLLSGATCEPSPADAGAASWMASLAATRASRSVTPGSALANAIRATCGPSALASLRNRAPASVSLRTSPDICGSGLTLFGLTFDAWAIELRRDCLQRRKWARRNRASACSSSQWQTIAVPNGGRLGTRNEAGREGKERHLENQAAMWPTARTPTGGAESAERKKQLGRKESGAGDLQAAAENWQTPKVAIGAYTRDNGQPGAERPSLIGQAEHWQSPGAMGGGSTSRGGDRIGETLIAGQAESLSTHLAPEPSSSGEPSSPSDPTSRRRLNPLFVEWLMGLPSGHTDLTGCEPAATAFTLWWPRMRSALSGLVCVSEP